MFMDAEAVGNQPPHMESEEIEEIFGIFLLSSLHVSGTGTSNITRDKLDHLKVPLNIIQFFNKRSS